MNELLAIVPARAGSQGVRQKNSRFIGDKPVALWTLEAVRDAGIAEKIVLCTDDANLKRRAILLGYDVVGRSPSVSDSGATIADVAVEVARSLQWRGVIGVFQPTSPTRGSKAIQESFSAFLSTASTSLMSVVRENHLYWLDDEQTHIPLFKHRVNRQFSTARVLRETGSIQYVTANWLHENHSMVSDKHFLFELSGAEAIDIDTRAELEMARRELDGGQIVFRMTANRRVGSGHLYHCLTLADELWEHDCSFLLRECDDFAAEAIVEAGYRYAIETDLHSDLQALACRPQRLIVNDLLDTTPTDLLTQRLQGYRVVCVEDLGAGPIHADWTVNGLYDQIKGPTVSSGSEWVPLRREFTHLPPRTHRDEAQRVTLAFGGTDPSRLTERVARVLTALSPAVEIVAILGLGVGQVDLPASIRTIRHTSDMAGAFLGTDLLVTSAGRTVYEAASVGTPVMVMAQNAREATHTHLSMEKGVIYLGLGALVDDETILSTAQRILDNLELRRELSSRLYKSIDGRGAERIAAKITQILRGL